MSGAAKDNLLLLAFVVAYIALLFAPAFLMVYFG